MFKRFSAAQTTAAAIMQMISNPNGTTAPKILFRQIEQIILNPLINNLDFAVFNHKIEFARFAVNGENVIIQ